MQRRCACAGRPAAAPHLLVLNLPAVWGTLRFEAAALDFLPARRQAVWLAGKRALLRRVAPVVSAPAVHDRGGALAVAAGRTEPIAAAGTGAECTRTATCGAGSSGWHLEGLLCLLQPGMAWEVELEVHPAAPEAALEALPWLDGQLTSSNLDTRQLPAGAAAALRRLPALRALRLGAAHVAAACVDARARLSRLSRLELEASFFPLPGLTQLAACASLAALRLVDDSQRGESLLLPPPASFRAGRGLLPLSSRGLCVRLCLALRDEVVRHSRLLPASLAGAMLPAGELACCTARCPCCTARCPAAHPPHPCRRARSAVAGRSCRCTHPPTHAPGARAHIANAPWPDMRQGRVPMAYHSGQSLVCPCWRLPLLQPYRSSSTAASASSTGALLT